MRQTPQFSPPESLSQGYTIKDRKGVWYVSFSVRGEGQQRYSLGTKDRVEAERLAYQRWVHACMLVQNGQSLTHRGFSDVAEEFIATIEKDVEHGRKDGYHIARYVPVIRRYLIGYFGSRQIKAISASDIEGYWDWRRDYWLSGPGASQPGIEYTRTVNGRASDLRRPAKETAPSDSTMSKEAATLRQILTFAVRRGYLNAIPLFEYQKSKRRQDKSRPGFTLDEFKHLIATSEQRVAASHINGHVRNDRMRLHAFCMIAGLTGLRPTELFNLTWGDIETRKIEIPVEAPNEVVVRQTRKGLRRLPLYREREPIIQDVLIFHARGKGKARESAVMPEVLTPLNILRNLFMLEQGRAPEKTDPVFANYKGEAIRSFKASLTPLLEAAGLRIAPDGRFRDSFSFRHFYVTQQIHEDVNHHMLARNAGTSTKMIDTFYSKIRATDEAAKLTPDWFKHRLF